MPDMEPLPLGPLAGYPDALPDTLPELSTSFHPAAPIGPLGMLPIRGDRPVVPGQPYPPYPP
ncbi:hypothetical protein [Tuwongella immobilis]|uniref:hypothetical protein n=1 Tax=Tuwongella immobilis TaxID=692036 RepID=UPI0013A6A1FD|nr:hypothetical protein [Tuwongella immobilis]